MKNMKEESYASGALFPVMSTTDISPVSGVAPAFNVLGYGAVGDGVHDDTEAIEAAIAAANAAGGGVVSLPAGTFTLSATQAATEHVRIVGQGAGNRGSGTPTSPTIIKWIGGAAKMFTSSAWTNSWSFDELVIDGDDTATHGVHAIAMADQEWGAVAIRGCVTRALLLEGTTAAGNTHFNVFRKLMLDASSTTTTAFELKGDGTANVCHNVFHHLFVAFTGTDVGVLWGDSDNNTVILTFIYRNSGTGYGIDLQTNSRANYFFHFEGPTVNPMIARTGTRTSISWYDTENAQPAPTLEGTAVVHWISDIYGLRNQRLIIRNANDTETLLNYSGTNDNYIRGGTTTFDTNVVISGNNLNMATQATPASAGATGVKGDIRHDTDFIYICTATNTWKRVAIATW